MLVRYLSLYGNFRCLALPHVESRGNCAIIKRVVRFVTLKLLTVAHERFDEVIVDINAPYYSRSYTLNYHLCNIMQLFYVVYFNS
jgi:hypothetical protein